jgi:cytochrome P450
LLFKTPIGPYVRSKARDDNAKFRDFCLAALVDRKRSGAEKSLDQRPEFCDIFYHLLTGTDPETGESYSMPDLACESVLLMVAGSHTTSTAIAAILFYLLNNPEKLAILSREIRTAFSHENEIRYRGDGKLADLPYLRACIDEGLRLTPPNPSHLPREVLPGGMKIDGHWFPAGVDVGVGSYAVQRSPTNYPDPGRFIPERWIQSNSRSLPPGLTAFSAGATGCIGKQLAYMEMHVVLAMLIHRFDLRAYPAAGAHAEYQMTDAFIGDGQGPRILLSVSSRI